jgi:hypothetical protein
MGTYSRDVTATNFTRQGFEAEKVHLYGGTSVWWFGIRVGEVLSKFFRLVDGVGAILNVSSLV